MVTFARYSDRRTKRPIVCGYLGFHAGCGSPPHITNSLKHSLHIEWFCCGSTDLYVRSVSLSQNLVVWN